MSEHDPELARWEALIDREAIGEPLDSEQRAFVQRYEAAHPERAHERAIYEAAIASLREQLDAEEDELTLARAAQAALARHRSERESSTRVARHRLLLGVLGSCAAAGLALWLGLRESDEPEPQLGAREHTLPSEVPEQPRPQPVDPTPPPAAPVDPVARLSMINGGTTLELGAAIEPGMRLLGPEFAELEGACLSWHAPTAVVCFEGELISVPAREVGERRVRLVAGRLVAALAPLGPSQRFTVETLSGTVSAIGTVFALEIHEGRTWVTVLEGRVEVRDPSVRALAAGQRSSLRGEVPGDEPTPLEPEAKPSALAQLVGFAELLREHPGAAGLRIPNLGNHSLYIDDRLLDGPAQLSIAAGEHALRLLDERGAVVLEQPLALTHAATLDLGQLLPAAPAGAEPSTSTRPPSAKQLAEAAQRERGNKNYKETARLYRELLRRYPDSPEAANVPVRLGDLLASTGDPRGALEAYELYLERGAKQLAPEAEYGRIQALRALGRKADERAAIAAFLAARPDDYRSAELQTRLAELAGD